MAEHEDAEAGFILGGIWLFLAVVHAVITIGRPIGWSRSSPRWRRCSASAT
ncbi:hypothetical protein NKG94_08015 [Micromonospora sp. M12]